MKRSIKVIISFSVIGLLIVIGVIYKTLSPSLSTENAKSTIGTPEQVADQRILDAKIIADKKIVDAKKIADKKLSDAKAIEDQKISNTKSQSELPKEVEYKKYLNAKFLCSIKYPSELKVVKDTANGNMLKSDDESISLQVYGTNNISHDTVDSIYNKAIKNNNMYYKVKSGNWFVISYIEGDKIVYQKKVVGKGSIDTFIFKFPTNQKNKYTEVVEMIEKSFKASSTDKAH
ncbi:hypothetical protein [Clostridium estertheticum]|uniref:Uncharacterized protein n=1 Tax=Clostridium estertheticum subsp. estertheticum TaxID=1552 RepID=A0A1J0GG63_9CLOT|nr:hypothetical protein [Clostridium estertheticum]APC40364.1 hypothetical protein A7L45_09950 [Clostridium estertheticum subsp. estertheticum]MBU3075552.1 hypothetical protein [Clostridium estertheticum]MBU3165618.1 hypothetical protein [Clostridium estertheticum]MBZ9617820.1 hypothetical protein [Clostridium estertheticum subsp. laramiense]WAG73487.1 hypothetical protein LL032_20525 [Clostridium estertheticum]